MNLRESIIKKAKEKDTAKMTAISIRVKQETKDRWKKFCKDNRVSQQATFEAILNEIMGDEESKQVYGESQAIKGLK